MDSFYEQPRGVPGHRSISITTGKIVPTAVPDVSMLLQNRGQFVQTQSEVPYNVWKLQQKSEMTKYSNKENVCENSSLPVQPSICRKQVRFESPHMVNTIIKPTVPSSGPILRQKMPAPVMIPVDRQFKNDILQSKPFEKIYMANIPNRSLDLSIVEPPRLLATKQTFAEQNARPQETLLPYMYKSANGVDTNCQQIQHVAESTTFQTKRTFSDDPSLKDLVKIIQRQNEQLLTLQKQVSTLLQERNQQQQCHEIEPKHEDKLPDPQTVFKNKPKFAIDVMTSFEVSIRPPNNYPGHKFNRDYITGNLKIEQVLDGNIKADNTHEKTLDVSLSLNEPFVGQAANPSPENSIHVDMQDFSSSEEDDHSDHSSLIGWTIYNNVMDQVNYMLKKSYANENQAKTLKVLNRFDGTTMRKVKEATLKQLKQVGVNLENTDNSNSSDLDSFCSPTEISCAVKQLLMKYLPDQHLAKICNPKIKSKRPYAFPTNLIKRRPEFSMATVQYMEKYNLITKDNALSQSLQPKDEEKLLDITALKQQPKLL